MKNQDFHYVVETNLGYWAGYNTITDQLRKARFYNTLKRAMSDGLEGVKRQARDQLADRPERWRIIKIKIDVLEFSDWVPVQEEKT